MRKRKGVTMISNMSKDDKLELERRRLIEAVTESVERTLRWRYTWLAIVVSFLIGGGAVGIVLNLTRDAQKAVVVTESRLEYAQKVLERMEESMKKANDMSDRINETLSNLQKEVSGALGAKETLVQRLSEIGEQLTKQENRYKTLAAAVDSLPDRQNLPKIEGITETETKTGLAGILDRIDLGKYTVFLHYFYSKGKDRDLMENISNFLKSKGYVVAFIQEVEFRYRNIHYFYEEDHGAAEALKEHVGQFLIDVEGRTDIEIKLWNLGKKFPWARKGQLELYLYF